MRGCRCIEAVFSVQFSVISEQPWRECARAVVLDLLWVFDSGVLCKKQYNPA